MANPKSNLPITVAFAVHKIQLYLLETPSTPFDLLIAASTLLSKPEYDDVVTERTISDLCGYPLCPNPLPSPADRRRKGKYRVSLSEHKVYDLQETYSYCCEECLIGSRALKGSMGDERRADVDVRKAKVEEVLRLFGYLDGDEEGDEVMRGESLGSVKLEIREKESVKAGDVKLDEWIGPSNAIEGYIPQLDRGREISVF